MLTRGLTSSEYDDYNTPEEVRAPVEEFNGGPVGLDPCSNAQSIMRATRSYRLERGEDGLRLPWGGCGLVFINPPYGDEILAFARKGALEAQLGTEQVWLIPHRTDTVWYHALARHAAMKCEWYGRISHPRGVRDKVQGSLFAPELGLAADEATEPAETDKAPFPSALLYIPPLAAAVGRKHRNARMRAFGRVFEKHGRIWR